MINGVRGEKRKEEIEKDLRKGTNKQLTQLHPIMDELCVSLSHYFGEKEGWREGGDEDGEGGQTEGRKLTLHSLLGVDEDCGLHCGLSWAGVPLTEASDLGFCSASLPLKREKRQVKIKHIFSMLSFSSCTTALFCWHTNCVPFQRKQSERASPAQAQLCDCQMTLHFLWFSRRLWNDLDRIFITAQDWKLRFLPVETR